VKLRFTEKAGRDYAGMPANIRRAFAKQLRFLLANRGHPHEKIQRSARLS